MSRPQKLHLTEDNRLISTREALVQAVLELSKVKSFDNISLREVTRTAGISPAAFYRHFNNMEQLGIAIVHESFALLRVGFKKARSGDEPNRLMGIRSLQCLADFRREHPERYRYIVSEFNGVPPIREAIHEHWEILEQDLFEDLKSFEGLEHLKDQSHRMIANLISQVVLGIASDMLLRNANQQEKEQMYERGVQQLRLIILGAKTWRD